MRHRRDRADRDRLRRGGDEELRDVDACDLGARGIEATDLERAAPRWETGERKQRLEERNHRAVGVRLLHDAAAGRIDEEQRRPVPERLQLPDRRAVRNGDRRIDEIQHPRVFLLTLCLEFCASELKAATSGLLSSTAMLPRCFSPDSDHP